MARRSFRNIFVMVLVLIVGLAWVLPAFADKSSNTLNFAWTKELETLDRYYNTAREGMIVSRHVYDDLIYRDPQTWEYKPLLATSWKWIDPTTMELELRKGVVFHNGEKFDADDVVYTLNFVSDPGKQGLWSSVMSTGLKKQKNSATTKSVSCYKNPSRQL
jgi:peptide/nickel transport system substrate-binding protein